MNLRSTCTVILISLFIVYAVHIRTSAQAQQTDPAPKQQNDELEEFSNFDSEEFILSEQELTLAPITIVSTPLNTAYIAAPANQVDEEQMQTYEFNDPHKVLKTVPGVYVRDEDGFGLRPNIGMRGVSPERSAKITLLEDGVLLGPAPYSAPAAYYFPIISRMSSVDIYKGPAILRYGPHTIGGAIDWKSTPMPESGLEANTDIALGRFRDIKMHGNWASRWKQWGVMLEGVHLQSAGFKNLRNGNDTGFDKNEVLARAVTNTDPSKTEYHEFGIKLGYANEISNETYLGVSDTDFAIQPFDRYDASQLDRMTWHRTQIRADYEADLSAKLNIHTTIYRHDFFRTWRKFDRFVANENLQNILAYPEQNNHSTYVAVLRGDQDSSVDAREQNLLIGTNERTYISEGIQSSMKLSLDHGQVSQKITLGGRFHHDQIERDHTEDEYAMRSGALVSQNLPTTTTADERDRTFAGSAYLVDEISLGRWFVIAPIARFELISSSHLDRQDPSTNREHLYGVVLPGLGAVWQPLSWFDVFAGAHAGFTPASPSAQQANPEQSVNYELGSHVYSDNTNLEIAGFFNDYSNLTDTCTTSGNNCPSDLIGDQFDAGGVHIFGTEASLSQQWDLPWGFSLQGKANYTFTFSSFRSSFFSTNPRWGAVEAGDQLPYVPQHQASIQFGAVADDWHINLMTNIIGEMRDSAGSGTIAEQERIPAYATLDAAAGYKFTQVTELYLSATNLFNATYIASRRPFGIRPGPPMNIFVGFKYHFDAPTEHSVN